MTSDFKKREALSKDTRCDVAIVGGGIAGLLTAHFLRAEGADAIVLEKDRICTRTTASTTAKITLQHGLIYSRLSEDYGTETAEGYYLANRAACEKYREMCESIDCDYELRDNVVYSVSNREKLEKEASVLSKFDTRVALTDDLPLPIDTVGGVKVSAEAQFNPLKFLSNISRDLRIYENTKVLSVKGGEVICERGTVKADKVVIATHFPFIDRRGLYFLKMYQFRSYVLALEGAELPSGMYVDESGHGLSFRGYKSTLLFGGAGHRTGKGEGGFGALSALARELYPKAREVCRFATQDCITLDAIPYIGKYSKSSHGLYVTTGFNKWGMSGAMVGATLISDEILGRKNEYAEVFSPSRSILKPQLILNLIESAKNLLTPTAPRCSHLGCALKWNKEEHTWDCPCHGSRFDGNGKNLDAPANRDIK